jgi:N,N'-diacetyllegionaminate synthase
MKMPFKPEDLFNPSSPCFIIAEAGVNHNGDIALARQLIDAALEAGADAVKFQTWITEKIITPDAPLAEYQRQNSAEDASQYAMLKRLELSQEAFRELKAYADTRGILFLSTPDEEDSADFLDSLNVPLFKIGSGEVTNLALIQHIARKGKPVILSTGMSNLREVEGAVEAVEETQNGQLTLLHCVSNYPADPAECNLRAMHTLEAAFGYPVGFSDHTMGRDVAVAAVALGARIIEKHLTLDTALPGPDHSSSLDPAEFRAMVMAIRQVEAALGDGRKRPSASEKETRLVVQKSLVARVPLPAQTILKEADFALRRTSGGLPPQWMDFLLGRKLKRSLEVNQAITPQDVE